MNIKLLNLLCLTILAIFICSCHSGKPGKKESGKKSKDNPPVEWTVLKPSFLQETITVSGKLIPFESTSLQPEVSGRVVKINLPEGKFVKKGTLLVKLFDEDLQAQLHKANTQLKIIEQQQKRQSELLKVSGISQTDYDQTTLSLASVKNDIEIYKVMIRKTEIVAPFDGTIGLRNVSIGAIVTPSTVLATIRENQKLKLDFSVPSKYSSEVNPGTKLKFTIQNREEQYEASVMASERGIDESTNNLNVRAVVTSKSKLLLPGDFTDISLKLKQKDNALMVPSQAIIPQELSKQVIVSKNGKAKFVTITTGIRKEDNVEVLTGLEPGDTIITTGILFIKPDQKIRLLKLKHKSI
ncbi:MAG: efflux RND transporter periplasmic adaptor subunit [Bacteroidota bacterium]|nr:efflux RND transporter periplasmic adaptor subunit [Bacteroidota bacterium]